MTLDERILKALRDAPQRRMPHEALAAAVDVDTDELTEEVALLLAEGRLSRFEVLGTVYVVAPGP